MKLIVCFVLQFGIHSVWVLIGRFDSGETSGNGRHVARGDIRE